MATSRYIAFGPYGDYERVARTVGELPTPAERVDALRAAAARFGIARIQYGIPIWQTLGLTKGAFLADSRQWLRYTGEALPLTYVPRSS